MKIKLEFQEEVLGTASANPELHKEFIASKSADKEKMKEELESLSTADLIEKSLTVFPKENGVPFVWDYQVKGFFKDACSMLRRVKDTKSSKLKAYKKIIDGLIFVNPRKILINIPKGKKITVVERPLRGQTAQGERIALASSECVPVGSTIEFEIICLQKSDEKYVKEWLDYGKLRGLGQWRNSGKGRFTYTILQ
jgi:hypothetical protein